MSGDCCQARGEDPVLRLQCILRPHEDRWYLDGPDCWWISVPNIEEGP